MRIPTLLVAGTLLAGAPSSALAQSNVVAPPPPAREDTVGPEQLRGFSLGRSANEQAPAQQQPPATAPAPAAEAPRSTERQTAAPTSREQVAPEGRSAGPAPQVAPAGSAAARASAAAPQSSPTALAPPTPAPVTPFDFSAAPMPSAPNVDTAPLSTTSSNSALPLWPWLLALLVAIGGGVFLWSRRRPAEAKLDGSALAFAGGAAAPRPAPTARPASQPVPQPRAPEPPRAAPAPAPTPARPPAQAPSLAPAAAAAPSHPKGMGIVSTRLRPWLDIDVAVTAAVLTEEELQLHLQLAVVNSGSTPARQVGLEVAALNAGAEQERELATYFARPDPEPRAAEMIAPLEQVALQTVVRMPRASFREYAAGGGRVLVPLVAVNAVYRAGSNIGRTSGAFLIGRAAPQGEKLGPLRTDQGPRQFSGVEARPLGVGVRR